MPSSSQQTLSFESTSKCLPSLSINTQTRFSVDGEPLGRNTVAASKGVERGAASRPQRSLSPHLSTRPILPSQSMSISLSITITITMRALSPTMLWCVQFSRTENGKCVRSRGRNNH
ncbi:hypothetical protein BLNAU_12332 [Blattamonas nauphoetae]|uniref:Uncharacterized protein n=1 Tax=Blattamonas nauphoetae TaxID=2049346 RepID=A0ABQ9XMX3_9EUKA|nr:hypothetical protein BLNAU_12332 [Blattamonas nauphoetae]